MSTTRANQWSKVEAYPGSKFISSMCQTANGAIFVSTGSNNEGWNGNGVYYSTDKGQTWTVVPGTSSISKITEIGCGDNSNTVWMATGNGVRSWTFGDAALTTTPGISGSAVALQVSKDGNIVVIGNSSSNTFVSTDGGATFTNKTGQNDPMVAANCQRIEYAISHTKNQAGKYSIYAVRTNSNLAGMHVSHDNGDTWSKFIGASGSPSNLDIYRGQGTYNTIVTVRPDDNEAILIGGIDIWKWKQQTTSPVSGGFEQQSQWFLAPTNALYVHADNHEMKWDNSGRLYVGNDGGIGVTGNAGASWYPANRGYNVTQFYGIAFDRDGSVMGGTQDNGTLYNNHSGNTYKEFEEVAGGDGFECEISFFNPKVMFASLYYNSVLRSSDGGKTFGSFNAPYPSSYGTPGSTSSPSSAFPFHTEFFLGEHYDLNSEDSVTFLPKRNYTNGEPLRVASLSTGDTISLQAPSALYYNDTVNYKASLTETRNSIVNKINNQLVYLDNFDYTPYPSASGNTPPDVDDSLTVHFPSGDELVVVKSVGTYKWYSAQHPTSSKVIELGFDSVKYGVTWDTLRVQDPFQSWLVIYTAANGGEVWGTRDALRLSKAVPQWVLLAKSIGGNLFSNIDMEFNKNLSSLFISTGASVKRIDGMGVYSSNPNFVSLTGYHGSANGTAPTGINTVAVFNGSVEGLAINPSNSNDLMILSSAGMRRSMNAMAASPSFTTLPAIASPSPFIYDAIIDREDSDLLVVGTSSGVFTSDNSGASWSYNSEGFEGTPVYEVRQNWRSFSEGNNRPGEIYIGTFGRGIWSSASVLGLSENSNNSNKVLKNKLKMFPNPTSNNTSLAYTLNKESDVTITVYSVTGALVKTIDLNNVAKGEHEYSIDASKLQRGTYIVRLTAGGQTETSKFIKQ